MAASHIAIVSHGGVIRVILCDILGVPLENMFRVEQGLRGSQYHRVLGYLSGRKAYEWNNI